MKTIELNYQPHQTQQEVHRSSNRFKVVVCGRRWGKSTFAYNHTLKKALENPNGRFWIVAPTYRQAKNIYWRDVVKRWTPQEVIVKANEQELYLELINGSIIELKGSDNEENLRGAGLNGVVLDEFADMKSWVWFEVIRPMLVDREGWAIFIGTPRGFNHLYELFNKREDDFYSWQFTTHDNPLISRDELQAIEIEYKAKGEDYYYQEIMAEFRKPVGVIFPEFNVLTHVIEPFEIPSHWDIYRSIDLGERNPTACLFVAVDQESNWYCIDEYYETNKTTAEHAENIMIKTGKRKVRATVLDENGLGKQLLLDYNSYGLRAMGQRHVPVLDGIARLREKIKPNHFTLKPSFFIFKNRCPNLIMELENYRYEDDRDEYYEKEKPMKGFDHLVDCAKNLAVTFFYAKPKEESDKIRTKQYKVSSLTGY